jgi:Zn-dependent peptidase ImmA (M78 family)
MSKKTLIASHIMEAEVMRMRNYRVTLANLPVSVRGFVIIEEDGVPRIVLNANLTREMNRRTMDHELRHIERGEMEDKDFDEYGGGSG